MGSDMDREAVRKAFYDHYSRLEPAEREAAIRGVAESLEERMRRLGRFPDRMYKGFCKSRLVAALGMSLGIHKQLLGGLTSASSGVRVKGGGGA